MLIKTSELDGAALDWAVAKAVNGFEGLSHWSVVTYGGYSPSSDWSQGGPLIEQGEVKIKPAWREWYASARNGILHYAETSGPTPLIAACRAIVAANLGDEVEVPEELV